MLTIHLFFFILVWNSCYPLFSHVSTLQYFQPIRHVPMVLTSKHETILVFNFHSPFIFRLRFKIIIGYWWQQNMFIYMFDDCQKVSIHRNLWRNEMVQKMKQLTWKLSPFWSLAVSIELNIKCFANCNMHCTFQLHQKHNNFIRHKKTILRSL